MRAGLVLTLFLVAVSAFAQTSPITIEHGVTVDTMLSDRFTWIDSAGHPRVAVLAHNNPAEPGFVVGPGGSYGGELREFHYQVGAATRTVLASNRAFAGFGYVVSHPDGSENCVAGPDSSSLGHFTQGTFTRVFEGRHHVIFRFQQNYPRYCTTGVAAEHDLPVTIDWVFSTGRDNPLWAITYDLSGVSANVLFDDSRAPYGELMFDGATDLTGNSSDTIAGVAWGDGYKFTSTTVPVTMNSAWDWSVPNTVPYVKIWTQNVDATMGTVQTQTLAQQDAGGYFYAVPWGYTSTTFAAAHAGAGACNGQGNDHVMPCDFNWDFQSINYEFADNNTPTINPRLAWGTEFGFLGQSSYPVNGNTENWGGPYSNAYASGYPADPLPKKKSYSTYIVLGTHSSGPVEAQVTQIENIQNLSLTATTGSVVGTGPAGVNRTDTVSYAPTGYNHVYGALAFSASGNALDATINFVHPGTLKNPLIIVSNYTGSFPPSVKLNGATLTSDVNYFASQRASANELWITLNSTLSDGTNPNRLQISSIVSNVAIGVDRSDFNGDGKADILLQNTSGDIAEWQMNGATITAGAVVASPGSSWKVVATGDFNGDGKADVLLQNSATGDIAEWQMNGNAIAAGSIVSSPGTTWKVVAVGDVNGDGKSDIILQNTSSGNVAVWLMNGFTISTGAVIAAPGTSWNVVASGDFDFDGKADLLLQNNVNGNVAVWLLNGTTITTGALAGGPGTSWKAIAVGDLNGDGKFDIVLQNSSTGDIAGWLMNGATIASGGSIASPGTSWTVMGTADYNGDNRSDILLRNSNGNIAQWQMNGLTISSGAVVGGPGTAWTPIVK